MVCLLDGSRWLTRPIEMKFLYLYTLTLGTYYKESADRSGIFVDVIQTTFRNPEVVFSPSPV